MIKKFLAVLTFSLLLSSCGEEEDAVVSNDKPYTVAIKKERSYYQAQKIVEHLKDLGVKAYIIENGVDKNKWFYVASGAFENMEEVEEYKRTLMQKNYIKPDTVFKYDDLSEEEHQILQTGNRVVEEVHRIDASTPDVPQHVLLTIEKIPQTNAFYIGKMGLVNFESGRYGGLSLGLDLPRGVSLSYLGSHGKSFAEIILNDNVYGDRVTFDVIKLKDTENAHDIASEISDKILGTDNYEVEEKDVFTTNAYTFLNGYRVTIKTKATQKVESKYRTYYVLADEAGGYIFLSQSIDKDDETLKKLITQIGRGKGLSSYDEFWNSFYLMPTNMNGDVFIAYSTSRVGWNYVKIKNYQKWAKLTVGLWEYNMFFYAPKKGVWKYSARDFLTIAKNKYRRQLFLKNYNNDSYTKVCGNSAVRYEPWGMLEELSFIADRYELFLNPIGNAVGNFSARDLISRAERFQYVCKDN